jgi:hypothetical protein
MAPCALPRIPAQATQQVISPSLSSHTLPCAVTCRLGLDKRTNPELMMARVIERGIKLGLCNIDSIYRYPWKPLYDP